MNIFLLVIILFQHLADGNMLYQIVSRSDQGYISLTAHKEYNIWDYEGPNRTFYDVSMWSN